MKLTKTILAASVSAALAIMAPLCSAQDAPPNNNNNQGGGGGGGGGNNGQDWRARMEEQIKTRLKATDEEWSVIKPMLEKVQTVSREQMGGRGGPGGGGRRNRGGGQGGDQANQGGGGGGNQPGGGNRGGTPELQALNTALDNEATPPEELKTKMAAVREARKKATADLLAARAELAKVLTVRQEAVLLAMGILE